MRKLLMAFLLFVPACFDPPQPPCTFACGPNDACPDDYACLPDGYCHLHGEAGSCGYSDLSVPNLDEPDLRMPDLSSNPDLGPSCTDGVKNGAETAIDCGGGTCPKCAIGKACASLADGARDCLSGVCSAVDKVCVMSACNDQSVDGAETDTDCGGGMCPPCAVGKMCVLPGDCSSASCAAVSKLCVAASGCADQIKDNLETAVDCGGGGCATCANGVACGGLANGIRDCTSGFCSKTGLVCVGSACLDQSQDNAETDVDCGGGICPACGLTKSCLMGVDCASGFCSTNGKKCVASACLDETQDNAETDVDCGGGTCPTCALTKSCAMGSDCASGFCSAITKKCVATQCLDESQNGAETDVDCGGGTCPDCALTKSCMTGTDCASGFCSAMNKKCVATQCLDQTMNGAETDVDCGGGTCPTCGPTKMCMMNSDCASNDCSGGICN